MRVYEEYDETKTRGIITTDIDNLELEFRYMSQMVYDYRMYLAHANYAHSMAAAKWERIKKELSAEIRATPEDWGIKPPNLNDAIKEQVAANKEVIALENDMIEKKLVYDKIFAACEALGEKSFNLSRALKLLLRNYYVDDPLADDERRKIESLGYEEAYEHIAEVMKKRKGGDKNEV